MYPQLISAGAPLQPALEKLYFFIQWFIYPSALFSLGLLAGYVLHDRPWQNTSHAKGICPDCRRTVTCDQLISEWRLVLPHRRSWFERTCAGEGKVPMVFCDTCREGFFLAKPIQISGPPQVPIHKRDGATCFGHHLTYPLFFPHAA